jgi:recombination protein RecA
MGEAQMGPQARLMSQALRKLTGVVEVEDLPHLHQSAPREDRRHVRQSGDDDRRPRAEVLFVGSHDIRRIGAIKDGETVVGRTRARSSRTRGAAVPRSRVRHDTAKASRARAT